MIRKEELIGDAGTIHQLDELEEKRESIIEKLIELEQITEDNNEEMVMNYERYLDPETRVIISKNEIDELNKLSNIYKKFNRFAFIAIGGIVIVGIVIVGLSYIIGFILL